MNNPEQQNPVEKLWWILTESKEMIDGKCRLDRAFDYYFTEIADGPSDQHALDVFREILEMVSAGNPSIDVLSNFATIFVDRTEYRAEYNKTCYLIRKCMGGGGGNREINNGNFQNPSISIPKPPAKK